MVLRMVTDSIDVYYGKVPSGGFSYIFCKERVNKY